MSAWMFMCKDTILVSSQKSDKEYMKRRKKVLTDRGEVATIKKLSYNHKHKETNE